MIKRVQRQFAFIAMAAMAMCVIGLIAVINLAHTLQTQQELDLALTEMAETVETTLAHQAENRENGDQDRQSRQTQDRQETADGQMEEENRFFGGGKNGGQSWGRKGGLMKRNAINQYAGRMVIVNIPAEGDPTVDISNAYDLAPEDAVDLAEQVLATETTAGQLAEYRYRVTESGQVHRVYLLDITTELEGTRSLLVISCLVGLGGLAVAAVFVVLMTRKAMGPVKESMERQKRFITDAGHELKTPLAVIGANLEILSMDLGENEWVSGSQQQVGRLRKLLANLISLSRLEEEREEIPLLPLDLSALVGECATAFTAVAETSGKTLSLSLEPDLWTQGEESQLQQLLTILCDNAVKYAPEGTTVDVRLSGTGRKILFETENDWDHAVPPQELEHLFDRFYRGDSSRSREGGRGGYGLGLSIAQAIAGRQEARLSVRETPEGRLVFQAAFRRLIRSARPEERVEASEVHR